MPLASESIHMLVRRWSITSQPSSASGIGSCSLILSAFHTPVAHCIVAAANKGTIDMKMINRHALMHARAVRIIYVRTAVAGLTFASSVCNCKAVKLGCFNRLPLRS